MEKKIDVSVDEVERVFENLIKDIEDSGLASKEDIKYCSNEDIASLKAIAGGVSCYVF